MVAESAGREVVLRVLVIIQLWLMAATVAWAHPGHEGAAGSDDGIGEVILSVGDNSVTSLEGAQSALTRGAILRLYDRIETGTTGRAHLRFSDGSSISMKPDSVIQISQYYFDSAQPALGGAVFKLIRGGLRTVSGQIGKYSPDRYRFQNTLATIGIRGTEYELYYCDHCCAHRNRVVEGIAGGVSSGGIHVDTAVGAADLSSGEYFQLARGSKRLDVMNYPPALLQVGDESMAPQQPSPQPLASPQPRPTTVDRCGQGDGSDDVLSFWFQCDDVSAMQQ